MAAEAFEREQNRGQVVLALTQRQCSPFDNGPGKLKLREGLWRVSTLVKLRGLQGCKNCRKFMEIQSSGQK